MSFIIYEEIAPHRFAPKKGEKAYATRADAEAQIAKYTAVLPRPYAVEEVADPPATVLDPTVKKV